MIFNIYIYISWIFNCEGDNYEDGRDKRCRLRAYAYSSYISDAQYTIIMTVKFIYILQSGNINMKKRKFILINR